MAVCQTWKCQFLFLYIRVLNDIQILSRVSEGNVYCEGSPFATHLHEKTTSRHHQHVLYPMSPKSKTSPRLQRSRVWLAMEWNTAQGPEAEFWQISPPFVYRANRLTFQDNPYKHCLLDLHWYMESCRLFVYQAHANPIRQTVSEESVSYNDRMLISLFHHRFIFPLDDMQWMACTAPHGW